MPRFFLETIAEDDIQITGADAHHIGYALRMRPGEHLTVCANNIDYDCVIQEITKDTIFLDAVSKHACAAERICDAVSGSSESWKAGRNHSKIH